MLSAEISVTNDTCGDVTTATNRLPSLLCAGTGYAFRCVRVRARRGWDQTFSARDLQLPARPPYHAQKTRTPFSIVTSLCNIAESTPNLIAEGFLCSVGERIRSVRRRQTISRPDQPRLGPISHVNKHPPSSLHRNHCVHCLEIRFREEGVPTGRLLPCSWNGCSLGLSFSISESRKNAFVKIALGVTMFCPYKGAIHGLSISRWLSSIFQGTRRIIPVTKQCKGGFPFVLVEMNGISLIDLRCRTLSTNET